MLRTLMLVALAFFMAGSAHAQKPETAQVLVGDDTICDSAAQARHFALTQVSEYGELEGQIEVNRIAGTFVCVYQHMGYVETPAIVSETTRNGTFEIRKIYVRWILNTWQTPPRWVEQDPPLERYVYARK